MMTLRQLSAKPENLPLSTTWYLADLGEARGKQELFTRQVPQRLKALRQQALIESAVSSNRIEGIEIDPARVELVLLKRSALRDRNEEELRGYRDVGQHRLVAFTNTIAVAVEPDEPMNRHRRPFLSEGRVLARLGIGRRRQRERQQCGA